MVRSLVLALTLVAAAAEPAQAPYYVYADPYVVYAPPTVVVQQAPVIQPAPIQREVIYPTGRYVLYGDGMTQAWQWVWIPAAPPPPPPPQ
jgi:hypothetical protein